MLTQVFSQKVEYAAEEDMIPLIEFDVQFIKVSSTTTATRQEHKLYLQLTFCIVFY